MTSEAWAPDQQRITPQKSGALRSIRGTRHIAASQCVILRLQHRHHPRRRRIQYAAASRLHHERLGILGRPLSRAMTVECVATENLCLSRLDLFACILAAPNL